MSRAALRLREAYSWYSCIDYNFGRTSNDEAAHQLQEQYMTRIIYEVVEHDGGWAYQVDGVFSETFPSHDLTRKAADRAAKEKSSRETRRAFRTKTRRVVATTKRRQAVIDPRPTSSGRPSARPRLFDLLRRYQCRRVPCAPHLRHTRRGAGLALWVRCRRRRHDDRARSLPLRRAHAAAGRDAQGQGRRARQEATRPQRMARRPRANHVQVCFKY